MTLRARPRHLEAQHGRALIAWGDKLAATIPELNWLFHVPNGLKLGDADPKKAAMRAALAKAEGLRKGVLDYCLPYRSACGRFSALWIELKSPDVEGDADGGLSQEQRDFGNAVVGQGARVAVCYRWTEAAAVILNHLRNPAPEPRGLAPFADVDVAQIVQARTPRLLQYQPVRRGPRNLTTPKDNRADRPQRASAAPRRRR